MLYGISELNWKYINAVFRNHRHVSEALLYGSRVKGNFRDSSDIDICLKGERLSLTEQLQIENELDDLYLPYKFDLSVYHAISNPDLIQHIVRVGKVIYERNAPMS